MWEIFKENKNENHKKYAKKHKIFFGSNWSYQDPWHILQNPKLPKNIIGFSSHAQKFTGPNYLDVDSAVFYCACLQLFWPRIINYKVGKHVYLATKWCALMCLLVAASALKN